MEVSHPAAAPRLGGRRIVVTGAGSGIGREIALLFAAEGAQVALLDRVAAPAPPGGFALTADVTSEPQVLAAMREAARRMSGIDGLVNAAGVASNRKLVDLDLAEWERVMAVNATGTYLACRAVLAFLREAGTGAIVNIASAQALHPAAPGHVAYAASKGAVIAFTKALAHELAPALRANVLCPGMVETPMTAAAIRSRPGLAAGYPLQRVAQPLEIARAALFLVSDESSFVTGIAMAVDGGRTMH